MKLPRPCKKCGTVFSIWNCPACAKQRKKDWVAANPEKKKTADQAWAKENPEKVKQNFLKWKNANREKWLAFSAARKKANPEKYRIYEHNRNKRKHATEGRLSINLVQMLSALQKGKCPCCKLPLGENPHLDHIMPLALGGLNEDGNMQLLRAICNMQKHSKHPVEFMQSRGFLL